MSVWIATPTERPAAGTCRVVGVRACSCGFTEADLLLRFASWSDGAEHYLDCMTERGLLSAGRIECYVPGIGWVLADTDPEAE